MISLSCLGRLADGADADAKGAPSEDRFALPPLKDEDIWWRAALRTSRRQGGQMSAFRYRRHHFLGLLHVPAKPTASSSYT